LSQPRGQLQKGKKSSSAFRINDTTGLYLKYAAVPKGAAAEYTFTFTKGHLDELAVLREQCRSVCVAFVCIKAKEICDLTYGQLVQLIAVRKKVCGEDEEQYQILVTAPPNKQFRVYVNQPGRRGVLMGEIMVKRSAFPELLFLE
jgi:hypothetical protein